jgi:hypothetical protein
MHLFDLADEGQTRKQFWADFGAVSGSTYFLAVGGLFIVSQPAKGMKKKPQQWLRPQTQSADSQSNDPDHPDVRKCWPDVSVVDVANTEAANQEHLNPETSRPRPPRRPRRSGASTSSNSSYASVADSNPEGIRVRE